MAKKYKINVGDAMPSFRLNDQKGNPFSSDELYDAPALVYFYPKDDTPGCTTEACEFRDALEELKELRVRLIGISPDSVESHQKFYRKYNLNFTLLADPEHQVCDLFDVWQEKNLYGNKSMGVVRSSFLIDAEGKIRWIERSVKVEGHIERVIHAIQTYATLEPQE